MIFRAVLIVSALLLGAPGATSAAAPANDLGVLRHASAALAHSRRSSVLHWLRTQTSVRSVSLGRDHQTLDIRFRDGREMVIVPRSLSLRAVPVLPQRVAHARSAQVSGARALVLEPFATVLGMGSAAGQIERDDLTQAGFAVTELDDAAVTVNVMATLPQYNVVYMHTHSGTTTYGEGVLVTGQLATTDPCPSGVVEQCPVIVSGVYGNPQLYYAVTSLYVQQSMSTFPRNSILFFNGCAFLPATRFWNALSSKGAGVMVSWDNDTRAYDDYLSGAAFFNQMVTGASVASSISTLKSNGYGVSEWNGQPSHLGYVGNGSITLAQAGQGQTTPPTPTPRPTNTPVPPATPRPTDVPPTATATPVPPSPTPTRTSIPASISLAHSMVKPGEQQVVTVRADPNRQVHLVASFPNLPTTVTDATYPDSSGTATFSFIQPSNAISRKNRTARIDVELQGPAAGQSQALSATYTIGYGKIDISSSGFPANKTGRVTVWVHTHAHVAVKGKIQLAGVAATRFSVKTGKKGWATYTYHLRHRLAVGETVSIRGSVSVKGHTYKTVLNAVVS